MISKTTWLKSQGTSTLICRDISHLWTAFTARRTGRFIVRVLQCGRCETRKIQKLNSKGYILSTRYEYPAAYVRPKGMGRMTKDDRAMVRVATFKAID